MVVSGDAMSDALATDHAALEETCRRWKVRRLFRDMRYPDPPGTAERPVELIVEFETDVVYGWRFFELQDELSAACGMPVGVGTLEALRDTTNTAAGTEPDFLREIYVGS